MLNYLKKKEKKQIKLISNMGSRDKRHKRKQWRAHSKTYDNKKSDAKIIRSNTAF